MHEVRTDPLADYRDLLEVDVDEFTDLFNSTPINLTAFFRDLPGVGDISRPRCFARLRPARQWR